MSALAGLVLVFVLPTVAGCVVLAGPARAAIAGSAEDDTGADTVIARGLACGLTVWLFGSGLLARADILTQGWVWAFQIAVAAVSVGVLILPRSRARTRTALLPASRRVAEMGGLSALVYLPLAYLIIRTSWSPIGPTPWYYYWLAQQVADAGSVPATSIEFATTAPFLNDYHLFSTSTAMLLVQDPGGPMTVVRLITLLGVLLLGIGTVVFATALGAGRLGALIAVGVVLATGIGPTRLAAYRPEGFALGMALLAVALCIDWLRRRDVGSLVGSGLLVATLTQVHGIAALTTAVFIAAAVVVSLERGRIREQLKRSAIAAAALLGGVVVAALVFHEASGTVHAGGLVDQGGIADPTWEFFSAARDHPPSIPESNAAIMYDSLRDLYHWSWWWMIPAGALALLGLVLNRKDPVVARLVRFTLLSLLGIGAIAAVFMLGWQGYVPRRTGASRLFLEASLLVPPLVAVGLAGLARRRWPLPRAVPAVNARTKTAAFIAAVAVCGVGTLVSVSEYDKPQAPTRAELALWRSLPLTSSDIVLANGYTEGFIPAVTGAEGLLDGRAPYTFGDLLTRANRLLRGGAGFFDDPAANWDFLADNNVTWVVVGDADARSLGTGNVWDTPPNLDALNSCRGLQLVDETSTLTAYRVTDPGPDGCVRTDS
jgi:hypothetical protein